MGYLRKALPAGFGFAVVAICLYEMTPGLLISKSIGVFSEWLVSALGEASVPIVLSVTLLVSFAMLYWAEKYDKKHSAE